MSRPTPYEFRNAEEITRCLVRDKTRLGKWFDRRISTLDEIARSVLSGNTFRAFPNMSQHPSAVFRRWAMAEFQNRKTVSELTTINSQAQFDRWVREFSGRFAKAWRRQMNVSIPYGPGRKLPNLLLKCFVLWDGLSRVQRAKLLSYLHVPLDSFTLIALRNCISDPKIPKNATMKFVGDETMYNLIQEVIRDIAHKARVPAIYFEVLAWDKRHAIL
jgi:hypothetical protein